MIALVATAVILAVVIALALALCTASGRSARREERLEEYWRSLEDDGVRRDPKGGGSND